MSLEAPLVSSDFKRLFVLPNEAPPLISHVVIQECIRTGG